MHHLIYLSTATHLFTDAELQSLLTKAREENARNNITGILLYHDGQFMQLLEGEEATLNRLYEKISQDPRHTGVMKMADKAVSARSFSDWSMAFYPLQSEEYTQLLGYQSPANLDLTPTGLSGADSLLLERMQAFMLHQLR